MLSKFNYMNANADEKMQRKNVVKKQLRIANGLFKQIFHERMEVNV